MGREIDERVVQMKFENGQFEKGISTSIRSMEELKKGMNFDEAVKGFDKLDRSARGVKMDGLAAGVEAVRVKFDLLQITAFNVLNRISNKAIDTGERMVKSLSIEQVSVGWDKFASKTTSVQTIMAATASQFSNTEVQMEKVNEQLDKLNWFTDETSYNFVDMVNNIGKFTSNNIDLETSVTAMQGIANWAAISGANANEASRAMYNLSQALATGSVRLIDWKSIENANMATAEFKKTVIETAAAEGTLRKVSEDTFETLDGKTQISTKTFNGFNDSLQKGWFSTNVLMKALDRYGGATNKLNKYVDELNILTSQLVANIDDYTSGTKSADAISKEWGISVERTKEILEDFNDEQTQFGLKAFKAAQEAKTFEDAINSVKDAVSTGWMKSFELIFGDYLEAKEFFTDLANTLWEIFAAGGEKRNEILALWKEDHGRDMFIDTIWSGLAAILAILKPIQIAWTDIFGEMTADRLVSITRSINSFVSSLAKMAKANIPKLTRTFRGLFAVLDMIRMVLGGGFKIALSVLQEIFGAFNVDVFEFTGSIGDSLVAMRDWMREGGRFDNVVNNIITHLKIAIASVRSFINSVKEFGPVKAVLDSFHSIFTEDFKGIESILGIVGGALSAFWELLKSVPHMTSLEDVKNAFKQLGTNISANLENMGVSFEGIKTVGETVFGGLIELLGKVTGGFDTASKSAGKAVTTLGDKLKQVDWAGVALLATGISILALAWKIADSIAIVAKSFGKATDVMKSVKGMTDAVGNYFKALKDNIQSNNILKIAIAVAILAASFTALAALDAPALLTGAAAIAIISGALIGLLVVTDKYGKGKAGGSGGASFRFAAVIVGFAAAVLLISKALNTIEPEGIVPKLVIMAGILGAVLLVTNKMNKGSAVERAIPSIGVYLGFAIAVGTLVNALKKISDLGTEDLFMALPVLAGLMIVMAVCARLATRTVVVNKSLSSAGFKAGLGFNKASSGTKAVGGFGSIIAMALAVNLMIMAIKSIAKVDPETMVKGLIGLGAILAEISVVMIASKLAGQNAKQAGKMILYISIALNLLVPAIKGLGSIPQDVFEKGLLAVAGISAVLSAVMVLSKFAGQNAAKAGLLFISLAGSLMALQLVIKTLGRVDTAQLVKGTASVSAVILALGVMLKGAGGNFGVETTKSLVKLTIIIGILGALMLAMSFIEPTRALASSAGISAVLLSLSASLKLMDKAKLPDMKDVAKLYSIVAVLGTVLGLIAYFTDPKSVLAAATGLSEVLLAVSAAGFIMQKAKMPTIKQAQGWAIIVGAIGGVIAVLAGIAAIAKANGTDVNGLLVLTTGMSEILLALAVAGRIMDKQKNPSVYNTRAMNQWVLSVGGLIAGLAIVQASINGAGGSVDGVLKLTSGMSEIILALALASRIMGQNGGDFKVNAGAIVGISALVAVIGLVLAAFSNFTNPTKVIPLATGLSAVMLAVAGVMRIIAGIQTDISAVNVGMFALVTIITGLMGAVLAGLSNIVNPGTVLPIALGLSAVMVALGVVVKLLASTPPTYLTGAWESLAMLGIIVGALGALAVGIGYLMKNQGFADALSNSGEGMKLLGQAIGGFIGGIVGGVVEGALSFIPKVGDYLTQFMENAQGFFDGVKSMPSGIGEMVGSIVVALLALTAADLLNSLANFANFIFGTGDSTLADKFKMFGEALKAFSDSLGENFDASKVAAAANAGKALAQLEASLPRKGGKLQEWLGEKDLATFGVRIMAFGAAIAGFGFIVKDLPVEAVEAAANAGMALSNLENSLPAHGGKLQEWIGEKDLGDFGQRIKDFGTALADFAGTVEGITAEDVQGAVNAGLLLADLEKNLPSTNGILQKFLGEQNLGEFGTRLTSFGTGLKGFSDAISQNGGLDYDSIKLATDAVGALVAMESNIDTAGGWGELFTGKSDFSSFGKHLEDLGGALKAYNTAISAIVLDKINAVNASLINIIGIAKTPTDQIDALKTIANAITYYAPSIGKWSSEASTAQTDKMDAVTKEIEKLLRLSEISDATTWIVNITANINLMVQRMLDMVNSKYPSIKQAGKSIAYWLVTGVVDGFKEYQYLANNAATKLGESVDQSVRDALQVASPSVKMIEVGHWVVKGLAEGITKDMSAEDAAEKKANNIVAAFQSVFDRIDLIAKNRSLQYELWEVNEGRNATDAEKQKRQLSDKEAQLKDAADKVAAQRAAFETAKKSFAEGSKQYIEAENRVLEAMKSMYEIRNEIEELQGTGMSGGNGIRSDAFKKYRAFIDQYQGSMEMLGWTEQELIQKAKEASGYGMETAKKGAIDTESIIASALGEQNIDIVVEQAKSSGKKVGSAYKQGVDEGLSEPGNTSPGEGMSSFDRYKQMAKDASKDASNLEGWDLLQDVVGTDITNWNKAGQNNGEGYIQGLASKIPDAKKTVSELSTVSLDQLRKDFDMHSPSKVTYEIGGYVGQGLINGLHDTIPSSTQAGRELGTNTIDGLTRGIEERGQVAIAAAQRVASQVASIMASTLKIASPSKLTRSFGNYLDEGLALGLRDGLSNVEDASKEVANSTVSALDYAKDLINDVIESDDDFAPTITPVLNLDEVNRQAPGIRRALNRGGIDLSATRQQAGYIDHYINDRQNGRAPAAAQTNYNFTQNNYSPKALNRAEIYRQTNNQFSRLKGASQR